MSPPSASEFCGTLAPPLLQHAPAPDLPAAHPNSPPAPPSWPPKCRLRVSGVPFFLISSGDSQSYALSGAQPPEAFQEAVRLALKEGGGAAAAGGGEAAGGACTREGCT